MLEKRPHYVLLITVIPCTCEREQILCRLLEKKLSSGVVVPPHTRQCQGIDDSISQRFREVIKLVVNHCDTKYFTTSLAVRETTGLNRTDLRA